ncbi:MAG: NFACT family protein [Bacilli bacterium]|jgi:putative fibronectin-binding protein|nr:NFACT family protein [Staphylococcus sp.]
MPYDGILIHFLISELSEKLVGGKINKIIEPSSLDLCLQIRSKNQTDNKIKNYQLFISSSLDMPRIYLTDRKISSFESPKNFCMVLRKYLERGIITKIEQIDNDRIIVFHISSISELGDNINYRLIVELMGRNSNIILINSQNIIIDAIRKLPPSEDSKRLILPKATYSYPPSNTTINPFLIDESNQYDIDMLQGVSKLAKDAIKNSHQSLKNYLQHPLNYAIYQIDKKYDFYILPLFNYQIIKDGFDSINMMLDVYYKDYRTIYNDKAKALKKIIKNKIIHLQNKIDHLQNDLEVANENLKYNEIGILLQANLYKVQKGMDKIIVDDFFHHQPLEIQLDPMLDPSNNLKKLFAKSKKAKNALSMIDLQLKITSNEIKYLDEISNQIDFANNIDLEEIKMELIKNKYLKDKKESKPKNKKINITKYILNNNEILVGKNNIQNEYITHKLAKSYDWWFHVKDAPGSHVIFKVPTPSYILTEQDIRFCANLAASFSKFSHSSSVPVDYVLVKYLKKIPGMKGSNVTFNNNKTIYIDPSIKE